MPPHTSDDDSVAGESDGPGGESPADEQAGLE
jgi:hypothetical protein